MDTVTRPDPAYVLRRNMMRVYASRAESVLDIGCGDGHDFEMWKQCNIHHVDAIDIDTEAIDRARANIDALGLSRCSVDVSVCDCTATDWGVYGTKTYDVVVCNMTLQYLFSRKSVVRALLKRISSVLRYYGQFIGIVPDAATVLEHGATPGEKFNLSASFGRQLVRPDGSTEYVVDIDVLKEMAYEAGLMFQKSIASNGLRTFSFAKHDPTARL